MKNSRKKLLLIILACVAFIGLAGTFALYKSQHPAALKLKKQVKFMLIENKLPVLATETGHLGKIIKVEMYENNRLVNSEQADDRKDNKKIYYTDEAVRLVDYPKGIMMDFPADAVFDFSLSPAVNKIKCSMFEAVVSREEAFAEDGDIAKYIDHYLNRFIDSEEYRQANNITSYSREEKEYNGSKVLITSAVLDGLDKNKWDGYTYVIIRSKGNAFYRIMFKHRSGDEGFFRYLDDSLSRFEYFKSKGEAVFDVDYKPVIPDNWTEETLQLYNNIKNSDKIRWGIFTKNIYDEGIEKTVPEMEEKLGYKFPVILSYAHFNEKFPLEFMQKNYENGRIVELTYQITDTNNENLFGYTPNIDIYRGVRDQTIREFAQAAKKFGHPFLFRLNNEMNSDWTSYSGIVNMSDPDIYIENWRRIYRIFKEEGVSNAIWIYNPNDRNYPPCSWNYFMAYYPGNDYVQMLGVTGYNTGTYYKNVLGETWREFSEIYDEVHRRYYEHFSEFPWIITEFASSSVGGDKEKWITSMFKNINNYKNIKIAVWFSYADYDFRPENEGKVSRPYWLDETDGTLEAFKRGIEHNAAKDWKN